MVMRCRSDGCIGSNLNALLMSTLANNTPGPILIIYSVLHHLLRYMKNYKEGRGCHHSCCDMMGGADLL